MSNQDMFSNSEAAANQAPAENAGNAPAQNNENSNTPTPDEMFKNQLASIKREDGSQKYNTVDEALNALNHGQVHISRLEQNYKELEERNRQLEVEVSKLQAAEDVVSRLTAQNNQDEATTSNTGLDESAVVNLVSQALEAKERQNSVQKNLSTVAEKMTQKFGDKARDVIASKASDLGTTPEKLGELASQNPQLVLALFDEKVGSTPSPSTSSVNIPLSKSEGLQPPEFEKSLLSGATTKDLVEGFRKMKEYTNKRLGVET